MNSNTDNLIPASKVRDRYGISDMAIWRWLHDVRMGFPQPLRINSGGLLICRLGKQSKFKRVCRQ